LKKSITKDQKKLNHLNKHPKKNKKEINSLNKKISKEIKQKTKLKQKIKDIKLKREHIRKKYKKNTELNMNKFSNWMIDINRKLKEKATKKTNKSTLELEKKFSKELDAFMGDMKKKAELLSRPLGLKELNLLVKINQTQLHLNAKWSKRVSKELGVKGSLSKEERAKLTKRKADLHVQ